MVVDVSKSRTREGAVVDDTGGIRYQQIEPGWDAVYNPLHRIGRIQHTAANRRPVRFTVTDRGVVVWPRRCDVPGRISSGVERWVKRGAPPHSAR